MAIQKMNDLLRQTHIAAMILALSLVLASCGRQTGPQTAPTASRAMVPPPVKVAILQDKTGSASETRTEQVGPDDLKPLIELLRRTGGELGVGLIRDHSNRPLLRLPIPQPPLRPAAPAEGGNPFEYQKELAAYQQQLARYEEQRRQWGQEVEPEIQRFLGDLRLLLEGGADAQRTDIWGAVLRADLFLDEPDNSWGQPTHRYAIFVTDGLDNVHRPPVSMRSNAGVIVVNGSASLGSLESLNPSRFESVKSAFQHIVSSEGRR